MVVGILIAKGRMVVEGVLFQLALNGFVGGWI